MPDIPLGSLCIFRWSDRFISDGRKSWDGQIVTIKQHTWHKDFPDCYHVWSSNKASFGAFRDELELIFVC